MKRLAALVSVIALVCVACDGTSTSTPLVQCPTSTPGAEVYQGDLRPAVPTYPNASNVLNSTPIAPAFSLETPTVIDNPATPWLTRRTTRFTTVDTPRQVINFYEDNLTRAGWIAEVPRTPGKMTFGYSVESTLIAARRHNPCAPTPGTGLPAHGIEITIVESTVNRTVVEVKEKYSPGY
jgi:hypothetical protein